MGMALLTVAIVQWPVVHCQARYMDDDLTVTANPLVSHPGWASAGHFVRDWRVPSVPGYYQPITMISLMLDTAMGGRPDDFTAYHRTSLALHLLNALLSGLIAFAIFESAIPATFVALLFGLHPLAVEPMAWVTERKTLLATFFAWLAVWLYLVNAGHRLRRIALPAVAYGLALLAKPSVVPVPLMLIVLDFWPLRRAGWRSLLEKWPLFAVALASSVVSSISQRSAPITPVADLSPGRLLLESFDLLGFYGRLALFPVHLTPMIPPPIPLTFTTPDVLLGVFGTLAVSLLLRRFRRMWPAGVTGAALYFAALAPTFTILVWSSFIAYGRYLYFPALGLLVAAGGLFAIAWSGDSPRARRVRPLVIVAALAVFALEAHGSRAALATWSDSVHLWRHVAEMAPNEPEAHNGYGIALERQGDLDSAAAEYRRSFANAPLYYFGHANLAALERERGNVDESIRVMEHLLQYARTFEVYQALATSELAAGRWADAERHLRIAEGMRPGQRETLAGLGLARLQLGRNEAAVEPLRRAVDLPPPDANSRFLLAEALMRSEGISSEVVGLLEEAVRLAPAAKKPRTVLAWALATAPDPALRNGARARSLAEESVAGTGGKDIPALDALGAASAAVGDYTRAVESANAAVALARASGQDALARMLESRVALYRRGRPYVEMPPAR